MVRSLLLLVALAYCAIAVSALTQPNQVYVKGVMRLPYAGIIETFESWLNVDRMRVSYYDGMDVYIFRQDISKTWQVNPENNIQTCVETDGEVELNSYLPDLTGFQVTGDAVQVNMQMCDDWQLTVTRLNKTSVYDYYISRETGLPVRYQMMGYDSLLGSHYDLYQVDYLNVTQGDNIFPAGIFDQPNMKCGAFPGPGASHVNPMAEISMYYPGGLPQGIVSEEYADFLATHGKSYATDEELRTREMHFHKNKHFVLSHQRKYRVGEASYTVGLNFLADHTPEEMAGRKGRLRKPAGSAPASNGASSYHERQYYDFDLPDSIDWRTKGAVAAPQDQGICGSCWSFGSTGAIEGAYFLKYGKLKVMAQQELIDCSWNHGNNGCDGGEDYRAYDWIMENGGISFKENYGPYLMQDGYCQASLKKPDVSIQSYVNITSDVKAVMDAIASQGPVSVSIDASHPGLSFYTGGVYYDPACKNGVDDLDHSVSAVGYGTDPDGGDYWIVKNSWSTYWGDEGFIRMSRKDNNCGVATAATYVVLEQEHSLEDVTCTQPPFNTTID